MHKASRLKRKLSIALQTVPLALFSAGCFSSDPLAGEVSAFSPTSARCITPEDVERSADQVLQLVNLERAALDLPPVVKNEILEKIADDYACRMIEESFFGHTDPTNGHGPGDRAVVARYHFYAIGENLAAGLDTPADVMKEWMGSPSHRAIILDPQWTQIGIGVRRGGEYLTYWVQEFGTPADF